MYPTVKLGSRGERFWLQARWVNDDWVEFPCKHSELIVISMEISHYNVYNFLRFGISFRFGLSFSSSDGFSENNFRYEFIVQTIPKQCWLDIFRAFEISSEARLGDGKMFSFPMRCLPLKAQIYSSMEEEGADDVIEIVFTATQQMDAKSFTTCWFARNVVSITEEDSIWSETLVQLRPKFHAASDMLTSSITYRYFPSLTVCVQNQPHADIKRSNPWLKPNGWLLLGIDSFPRRLRQLLRCLEASPACHVALPNPFPSLELVAPLV